MARNRTIYQSEAIYVSDNINSITKSEHKNISRVQSANYGFSINRERINQYGQLGEIDSIVVEAPNVDFEMSYYLTNGDNEYFLNLDTGYGGFLKNQIISSGQNIYIANTKEGSDINDTSANDFNVISIGNAFVTDYTVDFGVGSLPKVNVGFSALNISSQTNLTKTSGHFVGIENAGVNPLNGVKSTQQIEVLAEINQSGQSAIRPSDTSITITPTKTLGDNDSISILSTLDSGAHIQTASLNVNLDRTSLQRLGSNLAYAKVVEPPTNATVSISAIVNEVKSSSLSDILDHSNEYTIEIESVDPDGYQLCKYSLVGAKLDSESFGSAIGSNKVVDLTFTTQLGGIGQTNYNMFFEKYGFLDFFPSAAAAYSLRNLTADFDQKIVRVRRESDNSERDFTEYDIQNGTMVDWVNKQVIPPLDIRELDDENGNRPDTNDFIDTPAAAYSLRSLGENQANITIDDSSDERDGETGKFVVQTRRNVDGATKSFTAAEVTDGTLENFVEGWELYPARGISETSQTHFNITKTDDRNFRIVSDLANDGLTDAKFIQILSPADGLVLGKQRVTFDVDVNSGDISNYMLRLSHRDAQTNLQPVAGSNSFEMVINDDGVSPDPQIYFAIHGASSFDATISNLKVYKSTVNELPLDQATGAAAAYSLRNLSSNGTDVTTSGDTDGDTNGKYVVQVHRSSDDAVKSFTASEVANGTLENWVGGQNLLKYSQEFNSGWSTDKIDTSNWNDAAAAPDGTTTAYEIKDDSNFGRHRISQYSIPLTVGKTYTISGYIKKNSDNRYFFLNGGHTFGVNGSVNLDTMEYKATTGANPTLTDAGNGWYRFSMTGIAQVDSGYIFYQLQDTYFSDLEYQGDGSSFYLWGTQVEEGSTVGDYVPTESISLTGHGHVKTWYDQSGSDNHAVQTDTAKQPKIVEGGTYLEEVDFDGTQHFETISSGILTNIQDTYSVWLGKRRNNSSGYLAQASSASGGSNRLYLRYGLCTIGAEAAGISIAATNDVNTIVSLTGSGGTYDGFKNGADVNDTETTASTGAGAFTLGASSTGLSPVDGTLKEFIIYDSDQSTKRRAIEENIANHYDISLAAYSRDGTVSTWYDQSGSDNHATQTDPTKQPKIVDGGTLNKLNGKPAIFNNDTHLNLTTSINQDDFTNLMVYGYDVDENNTYVPFGGNFDYARVRPDENEFSIILDSQTSSIDKIDSSVGFSKGGINLIGFNRGTSNVVNFYNNGTLEGSNTPEETDGTFSITRLFSRHPNADWNILRGYVSEVILYSSDQSANRTAIEANIGETYGIVGIPAYENKVNGYVQTWYDQSGSDNDAVQPTAAYQPKIVGEVTSGQPHAFLGSVEFDGVDDFIKMDSEVTLGTEFYVPMVVTAVSADSETNGTFIGADNSGGGNRFFLATTTSDKLSYRNNNTNFTTNLIVSATDVELVSYLATSSNFTTSLNGTDDVDAALAGSMGAEYIGGGTDFNLAASFREIIIYNSDQSSNRPAIETNIANHYGITLS